MLRTSYKKPTLVFISGVVLFLLTRCAEQLNSPFYTPTALSYSPNPALYFVGIPIVSNTPTLQGTVTKYSASSLPAGLSLNSSTGVISGTPTAVTSAANYTVTATIGALSTSSSFNIEIRNPLTSEMMLSTNAYITDSVVNSSVINVDTTSGFNVGDQVIIIQMQDYSTTTNSSGTFEYATVKSLAGTQFTLSSAPSNTYYSGSPNLQNSQVAQIVQVYKALALAIGSGGSVLPTAWNGEKGGVMALNLTGDLALTGSGYVLADGLGFRSPATDGLQGESQLGTGAVSAGSNGGGSGGTGGINPTSSANYGGVAIASGIANSGDAGVAYGTANLSLVHLGSAGGDGLGVVGGNGGGAIISNSSTLRLLGAGGITSLGQGPAGLYGGAGSGGAIKLTATQSMSVGQSLISAAGGSSGSGMGRVYLNSPSITGDCSRYVSSGAINTSSNIVVNDYAYITNSTIASGSSSLTVDQISSFTAGDLVLLIQMQSNSPTLGSYEYLTIRSISGNQIYFTTSTVNSYTSGQPNLSAAYVSQLVRVPQFSSVVVNSGGLIQPVGWNGTKGGVIAFTSTGPITLNGTGAIQADGGGFRGWGWNLNYNQGESPLGLGIDSTSANGGGGGTSNCCNIPGGGGNYAGVAGNGNATGGSTYGVANLSQIFLGSAGGTGAIGPGGPGGGIVMINGSSNLNLLGTGGITSNGISGGGVYPGGGGSGGSVYVQVSGTMSIGTNLITALGGASSGGSAVGGVGRIRLTSPSTTGTSSPTFVP